MRTRALPRYWDQLGFHPQQEAAGRKHNEAFWRQTEIPPGIAMETAETGPDPAGVTFPDKVARSVLYSLYKYLLISVHSTTACSCKNAEQKLDERHIFMYY